MLKLEFPFFAVIAAIFSMEGSIAGSFRSGLNRLVGTLAGAAVGTLFFYIRPGNPLLMGLGTFILVFLCSHMNWRRAIPIACVMFAAMMLSVSDRSPLYYSLSRTWNTLVGIAVALGVNALLFPTNNLTEMRRGLNAISMEIMQSISAFFAEGKSLELNDLRREIIDSIKLLEAYRAEYHPRIDTGLAEISQLSAELESLRSILSHLKTVAELGSSCSLSPENITRIKVLKLCEPRLEPYGESRENTVYNYHVAKILEELPKLSAPSKRKHSSPD